MKPWFALILIGCLAPVMTGAQEAAPTRTIIESDSLEMQGTEERNIFYFRGGVHVTGESLDIRCQELVVTSRRAGEADATVGEIGAIERIVASGDVQIENAGRRAVAGRAEVDPDAGTVTLSENPRIIDDEVEVEGYQFVFYRDDKRVETIPDPNAPADQPSRSRVSLGSLPAIQFDQPEEAISLHRRVPRPDPFDSVIAVEEQATDSDQGDEGSESNLEEGEEADGEDGTEESSESEREAPQ